MQWQISVSCGIPDFRSANGVYARLAVEYPDLPDPQAMFDINYFKDDPRPFFKFAKVCACVYIATYSVVMVYTCYYYRKCIQGSFSLPLVTTS